MKLLLLALFSISINTFGEVSEKEMTSFMEAIKEKKDEELLIASDQFKECESQFKEFREDSSKKEEFSKCLNKKILGDASSEESNTKLLEIAKNLGLSSFNKDASKTSDSIRDYLQKRIRKAVYGTDDHKKAITKLKEMNYVDHEVYYQLYSEQVGKNTLLQVSRYCLENFGYEDPNKFIAIKMESGKSASGEENLIIKYNLLDVIETVVPTDGSDKFSDTLKLIDEVSSVDDNYLKQMDQNYKNIQYYDINNKHVSFWSDKRIKEFEVCTLSSKEECDKRYEYEEQDPNDSAKKITRIRDYRSVKTLSLLKEAEFALASKDPQKKLIKDRYAFCATQVIRNMCEIYKCNNVYNEATPENEKKYCKNQFEIEVDKKKVSKFSSDDKNIKKIKDFSSNLDNGENKGAIACNLMKRLEEYRTVLQGTKEIQDGFKNTDLKRTILAAGATGSGFGGQFNPNDTNEVLTISSTELVEGAKSIAGASDEAEKLKIECMTKEDGGRLVLNSGASKNPNCALLIAKLDQSKLGTIELDTKAKTTLKLKEIEDIDNAEDLEKFLIENGMGHYTDRLSELTDDPNKMDEIKALISQDYKAKRMALIDRLNKKFEKESSLTVGQDDDKDAKDKRVEIENDIANQTIADIETHKERVENLFQYANIASSFLELTSEDKKETSTNVTGRVKELSDLKGEDGISSYFTDVEGDSNSTGGTGSINYTNAIDSFLGISKKKKDEGE